MLRSAFGIRSIPNMVYFECVLFRLCSFRISTPLQYVLILKYTHPHLPSDMSSSIRHYQYVTKRPCHFTFMPPHKLSMIRTPPIKSNRCFKIFYFCLVCTLKISSFIDCSSDSSRFYRLRKC